MSTQLEQELREQPATLERMLVEQSSRIADVARWLSRRPIDYLQIAARGTSDNAARYAQYLFGARLGLPVALAAASLETVYGAGAVPRHGRGLVIGISQSGRSPDIVSVVSEARRRNAPTLAITNSLTSPLAQAAEQALELGAGPEHSVAATKTYTASLAILAALAVDLRGNGSDRGEMLRLPRLVHAAMSAAFDRVEALDWTVQHHHVLAIGRGYNYCTALEIALKVRELTATVAEGFSPADLLHGPIAAIGQQTLAIVLNHRAATRRSVLEARAAVQERGGRSITISEEGDADLPLPADTPEWLSPIVSVVPGQVLALRRASLNGHPVDQPRGLSKVTETL